MIINARFLRCSHNFFIQSLPPSTLCLFSIPLNDDIVDIEKSDGIFSPIVVADEFSGLLLNSALSNFWYWLNSTILVILVKFYY